MNILMKKNIYLYIYFKIYKINIYQRNIKCVSKKELV